MEKLKWILENWEALAALAYMGIEFWLGRTDKTKSGSVLELLMRALPLVRKFLDPKP